VDYVTVAEAAKVLRCSEDTIRALVYEGRLEAMRVRPKGRLLVTRTSLSEALRPVVRTTSQHPILS
jgi:excisionase family DNA binding protein